MALTLNLKEATAYRLKCGRSFTETLTAMQAQVCPDHLRAQRACETCTVAAACEDHEFAMATCHRCRPAAAAVSEVEWAALDWVLRRREDPDATYDDEADIGEIVARVGEAFGAMTAASSPQSTSATTSQPSGSSPDSGDEPGSKPSRRSNS